MGSIAWSPGAELHPCCPSLEQNGSKALPRPQRPNPSLCQCRTVFSSTIGRALARKTFSRSQTFFLLASATAQGLTWLSPVKQTLARRTRPSGQMRRYAVQSDLETQKTAFNVAHRIQLLPTRHLKQWHRSSEPTLATDDFQSRVRLNHNYTHGLGHIQILHGLGHSSFPPKIALAKGLSFFPVVTALAQASVLFTPTPTALASASVSVFLIPIQLHWLRSQFPI